MGVVILELQPPPPSDAGVLGPAREGRLRLATGTQCTQAEYNVSRLRGLTKS